VTIGTAATATAGVLMTLAAAAAVGVVRELRGVRRPERAASVYAPHAARVPA
jgi:hypothetical protein